MKTLLRSELESMLQVKGACISVYVSLDPTGREGLGDRLRLGRALNKAEQQLLMRGYTKQAVADLTAPAHRLHETPAWQSRGHALALLIGPGTERVMRMDTDVEEEAWGDDHFHIRPLLPLVVDSDRFYLLAISEHHVQFYEGNSAELRALPLAGLPRNVEDAVQADQKDRVVQPHMALTGAAGRQTGVVHGQGGRPDVAKSDRAEFIGQVAEVVDKYLQNQSSPLVLAAVKEIAPLWNHASSYRHTVQEIVAGSPDYESPTDLHRSAWPLAEQALRGQQASGYERLSELRGTPRAASGLANVLPAAALGRIETLFVDARHPVFGRFDVVSGRVELDGNLGGGRSDLMELAIVETLRCRGQVYALSTTSGAETATANAEAILRF